jgi:hypothetical protein
MTEIVSHFKDKNECLSQQQLVLAFSFFPKKYPLLLLELFLKCDHQVLSFSFDTYLL